MDLLAAINPLLVVSGFVVGMLVGLTGVGGGSLMTPILVLLFGVHATTAVGTDLLYAAITKTGGMLTHGLKGTVDWRVTGRLAAGSIPATILTLFALRILGIKGNASPPLITTALGIALVMTAVCVLSQRWLRLLTATRHAEPDPRWTATLTTFAGLLLGIFVTLSSVADLDRGRRPLAFGIGRLGTAGFARHWLSARHLLRQPSECAGAGQGVAAGPRDNPRHRRRAHAASLSIAQLVLGAEKASRDQAGRAPRWRLLEAW